MMNLFDSDQSALNFRQRWASYLTILVAIGALTFAYSLRSRALNATTGFENKQAGVAARYPSNWLLDQQGVSDIIFRVQDPAALPFKTTLQVSLLTVGPDATSADIPDLLNMTRASTLSTYRPLNIAPITLPNGTHGLRMAYAYVASEENPFLQSVPIVVRAVDVIVLRSNQALVITYRADTQSYDENLHFFDSFLRSLEF
jgi:hypothetical protein